MNTLPAKKQRIASYAFITADQHVLLSLLNRGPNRGKWTLVGGGIDFGESPKDALFREIKEEAGLDLQEWHCFELKLLDVFSHYYDEEMQFFGIIYALSLPQILPCKEGPDGSSSDGTRWFKLSELRDAELNPSVKKVLALLGLPALS